MKKKMLRGVQIFIYICYGILGIALICFVGFLLRYRISHKPILIDPENSVRYIEISGTSRYGEKEKKYEFVLQDPEEIEEQLGEPDAWIGGGILRPVYFLEDGQVVVCLFENPMLCEGLKQLELYDTNGGSRILKGSCRYI